MDVPLSGQARHQFLTILKANLQQAQNRIKQFADKHRSDRQLQEGDLVYLKIQPYRQNAFGLRGSLKLRSKYYGLIKSFSAWVRWLTNFSSTAEIHPVFHVSQLKRHLGSKAVALPHVPIVTSDGKLKIAPVKVLERRIIQRKKTPVAQWLVQWENLDPEDSTWEDVSYVSHTFPTFTP